MDRNIKSPVTSLNKHDRKVLDKYAKYYSDFIESNSAKTEMLSDEHYVEKE